ncbi:MAG TPA: hypothetical protein VIJ10_12895 [Vicinamibacteria bacterium]|jgi:hypothetical protein
MSHVNEDDLVLLHYREDAGADAQAHLEGCAECAERLQRLARTLALAEAPDVPEPGPDYGARVWARLQPQLGLPEPTAKVVPIRSRFWPRAVSVAALAAALVVAFLLGRRFPDAPQPLSAEVRERVLLVAVGEHLERSQMVLIELVNAPADERMNVKAQRAVADELVSANRLYRQTAVRSGEDSLVAVLEELERVLVEVAAGPDALAPQDVAELQRRIEARGLLFKVRVVGSQVRERERELAPRNVSSS